MEAKKKGFTLIELLATIVVIAIISLIAVPVVISVIEKADLASFKRSAESIRRISKNYYASNSMEYGEVDTINFDCNNSECISNLNNIKNKNLGATGAMGNGYVKIYDEGDIEFLLSNGKYCAEKNIVNDEIKYYKGTCEKILIDLDKVKIDNLSTISTTKSILIKVEASAGKSGISGYKFAIDGKWTDFIESTDTSYEYIFGGLTTKNHKIRVRVYNGTYGKPNYDESTGMDEKEIDASLADFGAITIVSSSTDWKTSKTYAISGTTSGATLQYKVVSGTTVKQDWTNYSSAITVNWASTTKTPTYIYARLTDGVNTSDETTYTETKIDTSTPSAPTIIKGVYADWTVIDDLTKWHNKVVYFPQTGKSGEAIVSGAVDNESGIARYEISSDNKTWYDLSKYNAVGVYSTTTSTTRYYRAVNNAGLASTSVSVNIKIDTTTPTVSYSLAGGTYNENKTVRVTVSDTNFKSMSVYVFKNKALVYTNKITSKSIDNTTKNTFDVLLDDDGDWTIYTKATDAASNEITATPNNGTGWYYQSYVISSEPPKLIIATPGQPIHLKKYINDELVNDWNPYACPTSAVESNGSCGSQVEAGSKIRLEFSKFESSGVVFSLDNVTIKAYSSGQEIHNVTKSGDTYTFTMPNYDVYVIASVSYNSTGGGGSSGGGSGGGCYTYSAASTCVCSSSASHGGSTNHGYQICTNCNGSVTCDGSCHC